jgi:hypothetical protein
MGTICWISYNVASPQAFTPNATDWDGHINASANWALNFERGASAYSSYAYTPDAADHLTDVCSMIHQHVSQVLPPQTIASQQIGVGIRMLESNALNNLFFAWKLYGGSVDGSSNLGNLVPINFKAAELPTSSQGQALIVASTAQTFNVPWRLVLEIGANGLPTTGGGRHVFTSRPGEDFATGAFNLSQDTDTTDSAVLIFSNNIVLDFSPEISAVRGM